MLLSILGLNERMVSEGRRAKNATTNAGATPVMHPLCISDVACYLFDVHVVLIIVLLLYTLLYHLVNMGVHVLGAHVRTVVALAFHY